LTLGKKKYAGVEERMRGIAQTADELRQRLTAATTHDAEAFEDVLRSMRMPHATEEERTARAASVERATRQAALVPLEVATHAADVAALAAEVAETGNVNAISDAASATALARAAFQAASLNVRINAATLADKTSAGEWERSLQAANERLEEAERRAAAAVKSRAGLGG
jgi:glutamate formiminotransferase/formiminotetrahydrofolate cyclodeaminase